MEQITLYPIAYKGLKNGSYDFDFQVDDALFEAYDRVEILGGDCKVHVTLKRSEVMLELNIAICGEVMCECDRCLEPCPIAVDYEGDLVVKFSDEIDEYDGEVMWISPSEDTLDLTQYIYESIVLSLPYRRVHEEGGCNPEMLASFQQITDEELSEIEARAEESDVVGLDDYNRELLAALKAKMEQQ
ncbi:MAG: DUF177 domain-containing protein [Alistipes sp.]|jgi:uncharacterized metal-binding protein YceD (DUF177 family)|nr:DUF177 domain-containing protein [Alistipes sp.]